MGCVFSKSYGRNVAPAGLKDQTSLPNGEYFKSESSLADEGDVVKGFPHAKSSKIINQRGKTRRSLDPVHLRLVLEEGGMWMEGMKYNNSIPFAIMGPHT